STIYADLFIVPIKNDMGEVTGVRGIVRDVTEQLKTEEELKLRAELLDSSNDSIFMLDLDGNFVYANEACYKTRGYTEEEFLFLNIKDVDTPEYAARADIIIAEVALKGDLIFEVVHRHKDGSLIPVEIRSRSITYKGKTHLLSTARDISERKKAEEALQKSEERYRTILDQMNEAYYEADHEGKLTFMNDALTRLLGYTREELIGKTGLTHIPADLRDKMKDLVNRVLTTGKPSALYSQPRIRKDGSIVYFDVSNFPIKNAAGEVIGLRGVTRDVTEKLKAEEALQKSEEKFRMLAENSADAIWTLDTDLKLTYMSPAIKKILGVAQDESYRLSITDSMTPDSLNKITDTLERYRQDILQGTDKIVQLEIEHIRQDRSTVWVELAIRALYGKDGKHTGFIGVTRDINDRKKAEEALRHSEEKYRLLADNSMDCIWSLGPDLKLRYVSPAIKRMLGFEPEEEIRKNGSESMTPESHLRFFEELLRVSADIEHGKNVESIIEIEQYHKNGSTVWIEMVIRAIYDEAGQFDGFIGASRDISKRKAAQAALLQSEEKYRLLADNSLDCIWTAGPDSKLTYISPSIKRIRGVEPEVAINESLSESMTPESQARFIDELKRVGPEIEQGKDVVSILEIEQYSKDGGTVWVEMVIRALHDQAGKFTGSIGSSRDISKRKAAEEALQKSEEKYRMLAENTEDVIWTAGLDFRFTYISPSVFKLRGFTPEEAVQQDLDKVVTPLSLQKIQQHLDLSIDDLNNGRDITVTIEAEQYCKDGSTKWTESLIQPLYDVNRKHTGYLGVTRDISNRKKAEQQLRESESKFSAAFMATSDPSSITEVATGKIIESNPAWESWLGYTKDELVNSNTIDLNVWADPAQRDEILEILNRQEEVIDHEITVRTKEGQIRNVLFSARLMDIDGKKYLFSRAHDITESKLAEQNVRESEVKYSAAFMLASDPTAITEIESGKFIEANPAWTRWTGFSTDELIGKSSVELNIWYDAGQRAQILEKIRTYGEINDLEVRIQTKSGQVRQCLYSGRIMKIGDKQYLFSRVHDITERILAEKSLEEINRKLADIINFLPDATMAADKNKNIIIWNRAIEQLTGVAASDMVGKGDYLYAVPFYGETRPVLMDLIWEDRQDIRDRYPYIIQDGDSLISEAFCPALYGGKGAWVYAKASPLHDRDGNIVGAIEAVRDITARKKAEEDIKKSEEKYRLLAENADDCIWTMDTQLRATYVSPAIRKLRGFEPEEAILQTGPDQNTPESYQAIRKEMLRALNDIKNGIQDTYRVVSEQYHKNGTTVWVESTIRPYYDDADKFAGFIGVSRDITARKKAEEHIKKSEEKYRLLAENADDCIWTLDTELNYTYISPSVRKLNGYEPEEMKRLSVKKLVTPQSLPVIMKDLAVLRKNVELGINEPVHSNIEQCRKDGTTGWIESTLSPYHDDKGKLVGFIGISRDVTERRAVSEALKESEAKYSNLIENIGEALLVLQDGLVKFFNKSFSDLLEYPASALLEKSFMPYIHPDDNELVAGTYKARMEGKPVPHYYSFRIITSLNQVRWVEVHGTLITWEGKLASLNFVLDITERKLAEQALKESEERYRLLAENTEDVIWTVDADFIYTYVSPSIFKLRGLKPEEIVGQPMTSTLTPQSIKLLNEQWGARSKAAQDGTPMTWRGEIQAPRKDGSMVWTEAVLKTLHDDTGKYIGFIGVSRDISERKAIDEALRESEAKYSNLLENAAEAILVAQDGLVKFLNKRLTEVAGYSASEMLETPFTRYIHPDDIDTVVGNYSARMRGEAAPDVYVFRIVTRDNQVRWAEIHVTLIQWEGRPASLNFLIDITDRKLAEKALNESEERYRLIAENTDDVIWSVDPSLKLQYFSPSIRRLLGYEPNEILKKSLTELMVPESLQAVRHELEINRADIESGIDKSIMMEVEQYHKDGHVVYIEINVKTFFDNDRKLIGFTGTARDITSRKASERAIRESEEKFRNIFEQSRDAILITDQDGKFLDVNDAMCLLTGYSRDEILFSDLKPVKNARKVFRRLVEKTDSVRDQELALQRKDGTSINVLVSASVRADKSGNIMGYQGIFHDMTERKRLEEERQKTARLESVGTLAGGIAHDFNNILGAIIGNISLAKSDLDAGHSSYDLLQDA
ncbi:MAG: PAS domain S-box protein, partial [Dehalococcoidia bacterium]